MYLVYYHSKVLLHGSYYKPKQDRKTGQDETMNKNNRGKILKINVKSFSEL